MKNYRFKFFKKALLALTFCGLMCGGGLQAQISPTLIDFEVGNFGGIAHNPVEGTAVNNTYFQQQYGITFEFRSGGILVPALYAEVGGNPASAFLINQITANNFGPYTTQKGGNCPVNSLNDFPTSNNLDEGCFFITDPDGEIAPDPDTLVITYNQNIQQCRTASGFLIDVDNSEAFEIRVFTSNLNVPEEVIHIVSPQYNNPNNLGGAGPPIANLNAFSSAQFPAGDGLPAYWEVNTVDLISFIEIDYVGLVNGIGGVSPLVGIAFDEFSYCTSSLCDLDVGFHTINPNDGSGRVQFFDQSSSNPNTTIVGRSWSVDGVALSGDLVFEHYFPSSGTYDVCLEIIGMFNGSCCTETFCETIEVIVEPNECRMGPDFTYSCFTDDCLFRFNGDAGTSNRNVKHWFWDFGDGTTSNEQTPYHSYQNPGAYTVCLTVVGESPDGEECCMATFCRDIIFDCVGVPLQQEPCDQSQNGPGPGPSGPNPGTEVEPDPQDNPTLESLRVFPNPVEGNSALQFTLNKKTEQLSVVVTNVMTGERTVVVDRQQREAGFQEVLINGREYGFGTYLVEVHTGEEVKTIKMMVTP